MLRLAGGDLLVDTGMRGSQRALGAGLARGHPTRPVLVTHAHIDHWGLATRYADSVLAHPDCRSSFAFAADAGDTERVSRPDGLPGVA